MNYDLANMIGADRLKRGLWWGKAWSLIEGCTPVSAACAHCWSARATHMRARQWSSAMRRRYAGQADKYALVDSSGRWTGHVRLMWGDLGKPTPRQRPAVWSVWNDLFHADVPDDFIDRALAVMTLCSQHVFCVLTKRPERMREYMADRNTPGRIQLAALERVGGYYIDHPLDWPLPNVAIGTTVESNKYQDRIHTLSQIPAAMKFVSFEPLLEPLNVRRKLWQWRMDTCPPNEFLPVARRFFNWAIIGAESGGKRRECKIEWVRDLKEQLVAADVKVFVKQLQVGPNRKVTHNMDDWPEELRLRQLPEIPRSE